MFELFLNVLWTKSFSFVFASSVRLCLQTKLPLSWRQVIPENIGPSSRTFKPMEMQINCSYHFSHVTKSRIFKSLNLRKKGDRNFLGTLLKNRFRHLKLYANPPSWVARSRCHMENFWKKKDWSSYFWESQLFRFWYVDVQRQRRLKSTKTGISSKF